MKGVRYLRMKYMGSKSRIAKYIAPIIQQIIDEYDIKTYIEPFCGGCNIIDKVRCDNKIASDNQEYLIALMQNLDRLSEIPEFVTKEHYSEVRDCFNNNLDTFEDWYIGAIGFLASYNGRFFDGGYAGLVTTKAGTVRNYYDEAKRNLIGQRPNLQDIKFQYGDYERLYSSDLCGCLFYCDPPYKNTKKYGTSKNFNHDRFWDWAERMSKKNIVLVSEYQAPPNWKCIWEKDLIKTMNHTNKIESVERLFEIGNK